MKRNFTKAVLVLLAVIMAVFVFVACDDNAQTFSVKIMDGETTLATYSVTDGALPDYTAKVVKEDYDFKGLYTDKDFTEEFKADAVIASDLTLYAKFEKKTYTIIVNTNGGSAVEDVTVSYGDAFTIPEPEREGYEFLGYTYLNSEEVATAFDFETYPFRKGIRVTAKWKRLGGILDEDNATTYFKERASESEPYTYVFLTGRTYDFGDAVISTTDGYDYVSLRSVNGTNDQFSANKATDGTSTFTLTVTPVDGEAKTIKARVVESVNSFGIGTDFNAMIANATEEKGLFQVSTTAANYVMDIGNSNFIPDIAVKNLIGNVITLSAANVKVTLDGADITAALSGNALDLAADLIGDTVKTLTFAPKYALASDNITPISFKVKVNSGVNVYTNTELKAEYAKAEVQCINILRNIKAELDYADYVDGTYGRRGDITLTKTVNDVETTETLKDWDLGTPLNQYSRGVYRRTTNNKNDNVVVNGNYFAIDGSALPYVSDPSSRTDQEGPYKLMEVQIGIFMYRCVDIDYTNNKRDINVRYADGNATINNLRIVGNARKDLAIATENIGDTKKLLKMSAAFLGVVVRGGTMNLNNTTIENTTTGIMLDGGVSGYGGGDFTPGADLDWEYDENETQSVKLNVSNSLFSGSWANNIYCYNLCAVNLANTKLNSCNGASIHFDDMAYADPSKDTYAGTSGYSKLNCELRMDNYTAENLQNWVLGSEAWFVAYGQAGSAALIKGMMDGSVQAGTAAAQAKSTILSADGSMMNFAILVNPSGGTWASDKDGHVKLDTPNIVDTGAGVIFFYGDAEEYAAIGGTLMQAGLAPAMEQGQAFVSHYIGEIEVQPGVYVNINMHLYLPIYRVAE